MKKYVIIGNSAAGLAAANKLRNLEPDAQVICISKEKEMPYNKCKLADYLSGEIKEQDLFMISQEKMQERNITFMLGKTVEKILSDNSCVLLTDGQKITYDKLFISTGAYPVMPNIPGGDTSGVFTFHTLEDANNILQFIEKKSPKNAVIIGAGMTGIECADALVKKSLSVSVVERGAHVLGHCCDNEGAHVIQKIIAKKGVKLFVNESANEIISEDEKLSCVALGSGEFIVADMVVFAVGVRPNVTLAKQAGIEIGEFGIITDESMQTNKENIYAGGDVAQVKDFINGQDMRSCTWPDACMQGIVVAQSMADLSGSGLPVKYNGALPFAISNFFGIDFASYLTSVCHKAKYEHFTKFGDKFLNKILLEDNLVKGFLLVGDVHLLGVLKRAIMTRQKLDLSHFEG